jgi:VanZ family protein
MWLALILTAVFIFYGSVYPFEFQQVQVSADLFEAFVQSWQVHSPRGDVFSNIVLFVPFGGIGTLAGLRLASWCKVMLVGFGGLLLALISQFAQFYVPVRTPALEDVAWNMVGLVIGLGLGWVTAVMLRHWQRRANILEIDPMPLFLIGFWLAARLLPFLPSTELKAYRHSLEPLLYTPTFQVPALLIGVAGWFAVVLLLIDLRGSNRIGFIFLALGVATLALEVGIVANSVSLTDVLAVLLTVPLLMMILRFADNPAAVAAGVIVIALVYAGLQPFQLSGEIDQFRWIPFEATFRGNPLTSAKVILAKLFFYSALLWFLDRSRLGSSLSVVTVATGFIIIIEVAQLFLTSHISEITDPILVLVCAAIIYSGGRNGFKRAPSEPGCEQGQ